MNAVFFFWLLAAVIFYAYFGYALILWLVTRASRLQLRSTVWPSVTCIIACYNEENVIADKLANTKGLEYPEDKLKIVVVDDGSTDGTKEVVNSVSGVQFIRHAVRKGKAAALNTAMAQVSTPLVVFSDANALLNAKALHHLVPHFERSKVGGVAGEKKLAAITGLGTAEGWYWRYESFLKRLDASFNSVIGATGELFAMRTALYQPIKENVILDDFFLSMHLCQQGQLIAYEPEAFAIEHPSQQLRQEYRRKVRIAAGAFQSFSFISFKKLWHYPRLLFQIFSRRWLRWIVCPLSIPLLFILNYIIVDQGASVLYTALLWAQILFYIMAVIGGITLRHKSHPLFSIPFYFLFMNYCMVVGGIYFFTGRQTVLWNKAERKGAQQKSND